MKFCLWEVLQNVHWVSYFYHTGKLISKELRDMKKLVLLNNVANSVLRMPSTIDLFPVHFCLMLLGHNGPLAVRVVITRHPIRDSPSLVNVRLGKWGDMAPSMMMMI